METIIPKNPSDEVSGGDLIFAPELALPPSSPKPTNRVLNVLNRHLPGLFGAMEGLTGLESASIHFAGGSIEGILSSSPKYLHARCTGDLLPVTETNGVAVVSGVCLFGEAGLNCFGPDGIPTALERPGVSVSDGLPTVMDVQKGETQLYVPESVARLGRTIVALAEVAASKYDKPTKVYVHLPGSEYKLQAELAFASGKITLEALHKYYRLVDAEVADIAEQFTRILGGTVLTFIEFGSPLDEIMHDIDPGSLTTDCFKGTKFEEIVHDVESMRYVEYASEVTAYSEAARSGSLPIFVDNHAQEKTFKEAKKKPGFTGIALYPLPLCVSKQSKNLLYHSGASQEEIQLAVAPWTQNI